MEELRERPSLGRQAQTNETYALVIQAIGRLRDRYRQIVYLGLVEEWTSSEIAGSLRLREGTVRMRMLRGLEMLRLELRRRGVKEFDLG
jgi:RNA polymerase sigma factor (sigma-70 family)